MIENKVKIQYGYEQKFLKTDNPQIRESKFSVKQKNTNETEELLKKEPFYFILFYLRQAFSDFSWYPTAWTEEFREDHFDWNGNTFCIFRQKFIYPEEFGTRKVGEGYYKIRFNRSEGFKEIFNNRIFVTILAAKFDQNWV